jgi:glutamate transport system substrate-binding protein
VRPLGRRGGGREAAIRSGRIDFYVGIYSITDARKQLVSFAGPYFVAGQDLLVRRSDTSITGKEALAGCVTQLPDRRVDAVTTDDAILKGFAALNPGRLRVVGRPFSKERYGVGLARDDAALRGRINDILQAAVSDGSWAKIYDSTLGRSGAQAEPPQLDRY